MDVGIGCVIKSQKQIDNSNQGTDNKKCFVYGNIFYIQKIRRDNETEYQEYRKHPICINDEIRVVSIEAYISNRFVIKSEQYKQSYNKNPKCNGDFLNAFQFCDYIHSGSFLSIKVVVCKI